MNPFRIERKAANLYIPQEARERAKARYAGDSIRILGESTLGLVSKHEVRNVLVRSDILKKMSMERFAKRILEAGRSSTRRIEAPVEDIIVKEGKKEGDNKLAIVVQDLAGALAEEREDYLAAIVSEAGMHFEFSRFSPDITIGHLDGRQDLQGLMEEINPHIPGLIMLGRTRSYPDFT